MEKKAGNTEVLQKGVALKEVQMTSSHGNKTIAAAAGLCLTTLALLFGSALSERRTKIRLYEKKYFRAISSLEMNNQKKVSADANISDK